MLTFNKMFILPFKVGLDPIFSLENISFYFTNLIKVNFNEIVKVILSLPFAKLSIKHSIESSSVLKWNSSELDQVNFLLNSIMNLSLQNSSISSNSITNFPNPFSSFLPFVIVFSLVPNIPFASRILEWESTLEPIITLLSLIKLYSNVEIFHKSNQIDQFSGTIRNNSSINILRNQLNINKRNYSKVLISLSFSLLHYISSEIGNLTNISPFVLLFDNIEFLISQSLIIETYDEVSSCLKYFADLANYEIKFKNTMRLRQNDLKLYILNPSSPLWNRIFNNVIKLFQEEVNLTLNDNTLTIIKEATFALPSHLSSIISQVNS